jgi:hypothetical protein
MSWIDNVPTFKAAVPLAARRFVKIATAVTDSIPASVKYAGATGIPHGITQYAGITGDLLAVKTLEYRVQELEVTISTAIVVGTTIYPMANGIGTDHKTTNATSVAVSLQQAGASGDHIQVLLLGRY